MKIRSATRHGIPDRFPKASAGDFVSGLLFAEGALVI